MALKIGRPGEAVGEGEDRVSWGAIFAGAACALALQIVFSLATAGLGLELVDDGDPSGAGWGSGIFFALTAIASMFAGGSIAGRLSGQPFLPSAVLHGVVVWALVLLGVAWLSVSATGALISGATSAVSTAGSAVGAVASGSAQAIGSAVSAVAPNLDDIALPDAETLVPRSIEQDLEQILGEQDVSAADIRREARSLAAEIVDEREVDRARRIATGAARQMLRSPGEAGAILEDAISQLTAPEGPLGSQQFDELQAELQSRYGISEEQSAEVVARWRSEFEAARDQAVETYRQTFDTISQELNDAAQAATDAAEAVADAAASAAWWAAIGSFVGLFAAAIGAAVGRPEDIVVEPAATRTTPRT